MNARGEGKLKVLLWLAVLGALFFVGFRIVPVYVKAYELRDYLRVEAKTFPTAWPKKTAEGLKKDILTKAQQLDLPLTPEQLQVSETQGGVAVAASFSVPVDLLVMRHTLAFDFRTDTQQARTE